MVKQLDRAKGKVTAHIEAGGKVQKMEFDTVISAVGLVVLAAGLVVLSLPSGRREKTDVATTP